MIFTTLLALFIPLIGFLFLLATASFINRKFTQWIACSTILVSFISFIFLLLANQKNYFETLKFTLYQWIAIDAIQANFTLQIDSLSLLMALIITGVGFLIHLYSIGYMDHEKDFARYFALLNFFIFAMLVLVLAGDLLLLFVGWEGVGLASYLLIGFWYEKPSAAQAATKAFVINRIGDLGFLLGLLLTYYLFGTSDISTVSQIVKQQFSVGAPIITILTLLYFIGATGKSAQIPLYTWLPDAMEGPTPVSALIHAATMVTAGVYLIVRLQDLFLLAPLTLQIVGIIGGVTALFASICALAQTDLKRVLAYSTVSQLGLMFLACGAGAFYSAMFHLTMHAFIKALLFLSAGNVLHLLHGTTEMSQMGGLAKPFKITNQLFLIGVLALSGIPPFAAFFSKDLILEQEHLAGYHALFYIGLVASILTSFYLTRAYCLTFLGSSALSSQELEQQQDAPKIMNGPVSVLAFLSLIGGFLGFTFDQYPLLESFLASTVPANFIEQQLNSGFILTRETWLAVGGALIGIGSAFWLYTTKKEQLGHTIETVKHAFYVNEFYYLIIGWPAQKIATSIAYFSEPKIFDQSIHLVEQVTEQIATGLQKVQSGQIRSYVAWMVLGSVLLMIFLVF